MQNNEGRAIYCLGQPNALEDGRRPGDLGHKAGDVQGKAVSLPQALRGLCSGVVIAL